jgi:hypothetical protein
MSNRCWLVWALALALVPLVHGALLNHTYSKVSSFSVNTASSPAVRAFQLDLLWVMHSSAELTAWPAGRRRGCGVRIAGERKRLTHKEISGT